MTHGTQRRRTENAGLFDVFIHLHLLHAASKKTVSALQLAEALDHRGFRISTRSVQALLSKFERRGWLRSQDSPRGASRMFRATRAGRIAIREAKGHISILWNGIAAAGMRKQSNTK